MYKQEERKTTILFISIVVLRLVMPLELTELKSQENESKLWSSILRQIDKEVYFDYALIVGEIQHEFLLKLLEVELKKCVILNSNFTNNSNLDIFFNNFVAIVFMPNNLLRFKENLEIFVKDLAEKLDLRRFTRLILIEPQIMTKECNENLVILLKMCNFYKLPNVILVLNDFSHNLKYYSYKAFPYFEVKLHVYNGSFSGIVFPDKMDNAYGAILRTIPDQIMPRSVVYRNRLGHISVTGYISKFIHLYGEYINSTVKYPDDLAIGDVLFYRDFFNWTQMNLLDIPCSITPMVAGNIGKLMSHTFELLDWCLMMPVEQPLTYQDFLENYFSVHIILTIFVMNIIFTALLISSLRLLSLRNRQKFSIHLADIFANPQVILGHLGSSFSLHPKPALSLRIVYMVLFLTGLLNTTAFSVQLNAFLTHPSVHHISSLNEMLKYSKKILAAQKEHKILLKLSGTAFLPYSSLFHIIESYKEFSEIRSSFNTDYSYPVTSSVWYIYDTQQELFSKPLFRFTNICFVKPDIMGFILPRNSVHKQKLDTLIMRVHDMGFLTHWLETNFYDLVRIGIMSLTDISVSPDNTSYIQTTDFYIVLLAMLKAFSVSLFVFIIEHLWYYREYLFNLLYFKPKITRNKI